LLALGFAQRLIANFGGKASSGARDSTIVRRLTRAASGSMKVAPAVAEVLGVVDDAAGSHTEGYGEVLSVAHAPPAAIPAPRPAEMERGPAAADEVQPGAGGVHGFVEFLGRWNEKEHDRAMPIKFKIWPIIWGRDTYIRGLRVAFSRFVDELVQNGASSGILAIRGHEFSWSASPDDKSYQRHGFVGTESTTHENIRFADFEGVVTLPSVTLPSRGLDQMAVYRVTLPSGGLDSEKWVGRPPPLAPEDLYTGPRSDGLLSTDDVSGEYCWCCFPFGCGSITVRPIGPDTIETLKHNSLLAFPCGTFSDRKNDIKTRKPGTNVFLGPRGRDYDDMDFSEATSCGIPSWSFMPFGEAECTYLRCSKGRQFHKVETKDIAGTWLSCAYMWMLYPPLPFVRIARTTKKALNEDEYEESGWSIVICPPCLPCPISETFTRRYVNGHPTNAFNPPRVDVNDRGNLDHWYRDSGCIDGTEMNCFPACATKC
jgi:hypothetical protein